MSAVAIRAALETALNGMSPALATAWQNDDYNPTTGTPFQRVAVINGSPIPIEMSGKWHREPGFMDVVLHYPKKTGPNAAEARAELIRDTFKHGTEFTASGVTVMVSNTPDIAPALPDEQWFVVPVRVPFHAHLRRN